MLKRRSVLKSILATGFVAGLPRFARAAFPDQPIRIIVPFAAGGNVDLQCRVLANRMSQLLQTTVIVENRAGAGGATGADLVAKSKPDGYTLLGGSNGPMTVSPAVRTKSPYDPLKDFAPIGLTSRVPMVLAVSKDFPAKNLQEFLAHARTNKVTMASSGVGSSSHFVLVDLGAVTKINIVHVPYRGASATIPDLISGTVDSLVTEVPNVSGAHLDGRARILGVAAKTRSPLIPEVPTFAEAGLPNFTAFSFCGLLAPAGTPADVVETLRASVAKCLSEPDVRKKFEDLALEIAPPEDVTPAGFGKLLAEELAATKKTAALANIKMDN
jgi:tripartite-type tricarboxylate transporter receptor subunit TctC